MRTRSSFCLVFSAVLALGAPLLGQDDSADPDAPAKEQDSTQDDVILQQDSTGTIEGYGGTFMGLKHLERIQFLSDIATLRNSKPLLPFRGASKPLDLSLPQPLPLGRTAADPVFGSPLSPVMSPIRNIESYLGESLGLNFGIYYTLLWQNVSKPLQGEPRNLGTGRMDLNIVWNLFNDPDSGHGLIGFLLRQGNQIGVMQTENTGTSVGSTIGLDALYTSPQNGAPQPTINLLYFQYGFFDDQVVVSAGKIHPNQYIALNFWANDESKQFLAAPFDGIQPLGDSLGGYQLGVALQVIPTDWLFVNAVVTDALGYPSTSFSTLDEGYYWTSAEVGIILPFDEEKTGGPAALSFIWANQNLYDAPRLDPATRKTSNSVAVQLQGHFTTDFGYFAQYGIAEPGMSLIEQQFSVGIGVDKPFGRGGDRFGVAFNWSKPSSDFRELIAPIEVDEQSMFEIFYRIQLTGSMQLSPDLQIVLDPGGASGGPTQFIFGLRLRTDF